MSPIVKTLCLFFILLGLIAATFSVAVSRHSDDDGRVQFRLVDHHGNHVSQQDFGGRHLMVFFGFTSCQDVCPTQMSKITQTMTELDNSGHGSRVRPLFISVDPERDTPQKMAAYLNYFDDRFVGLTGSRAALKQAAGSFKTLLADYSDENSGDYQIAHSSITYIVDPFGRVVDVSPGSDSATQMAAKLRGHL